MVDSAIDPSRYPTQFATVRGVRLAFVREGVGGVPLLLVHGWPETKRLYWKVIDPLVSAGFEVIVPDVRGFGESEPGEFGDTVAAALDLLELLTELGHPRAMVLGGDAGGSIIQEMAVRAPGRIDKMVLFNSPLPYDKATMVNLKTRPAREASDYFVRQGNDADALAAELATPEERLRYIATFYTSRFWAHPGAFSPAEVAFQAAPFGDGSILRSSFRFYESAFSASARSEPAAWATNPTIRTLILFGTSDHVIYPDFDLMATCVFPNHVGPFLLRDCGHFVPWEAPHALVSATALFAGLA